MLFRATWEVYIRRAQGFLLVYSITSRNTFDEVAYLHQRLSRMKGTGPVPVIIVGNQCDRDYRREVGMNGVSTAFSLYSGHRLVLSLSRRYHHMPHLTVGGMHNQRSDVFVLTEGRDLAKQLGCGFVETSAKQRINVDEPFTYLVREIRKSRVPISSLTVFTA